MNYIIPEKIQKLIEGKSYEIDDIGKSDSEIMIFDDMVLKVQKFRAENDSSVEMMRWLEGKIPAPKVICYETDGRYQYLLMTRVKGMMACDRYYMDRPKELFELLEKAGCSKILKSYISGWLIINLILNRCCRMEISVFQTSSLKMER